jgi:hypothetical protein
MDIALPHVSILKRFNSSQARLGAARPPNFEQGEWIPFLAIFHHRYSQIRIWLKLADRTGFSIASPA